MNKKDYISIVSESTGCTREVVGKIIGTAHDIIKEALKRDDVVKIYGFGTFYSKKKSKRTGTNPQTGEKIEIPAKKVVKFKPSDLFNIWGDVACLKNFLTVPKMKK